MAPWIPCTIAAENTAKDTVKFTFTYPTTTTALQLDPGDGSAPIDLTPSGTGTSEYTHVYGQAGHHVYTAAAAATAPPWSTTLQDIADQTATLLQLSEDVPTLDAISATVRTATTQVTVDVGAATIWAGIQPGDPLPTVAVDTYIAPGPSPVAYWEISRSADSGLPVVIAVGEGPSQGTSLTDAQAPIGQWLTYTLSIRYADGTTFTISAEPVIIDGTIGCFLTDASTSATVPITLVAWPQRDYAARASVLTMIGRPDPVVRSDVHTWASGEWTFYTPTDQAGAALLNVLTGSNTVLLRTQPGSSIASVYGAVLDISEQRASNNGADQRRMWVVRMQEIAPIPAAARLTTATLQDLADAAPTLGDLAELRPTLLSLSRMRFQ